MAIATYKDLCIDAVDTRLMGEFWAATLDRRMETRDDGLVVLHGATPQHTVWVNPVPEPVTVKQRVHLDVAAATVEEVLARGATPSDLDSFSWKVLLDPEGGELCVFERERVPAERLYEIGVDSADAERIATWWADVLGGRVEVGGEEDGQWYAVKDVAGLPFEYVVFVDVPEPKTVKNRIHWDVDTPDLALLTAAGAELVRPRDESIGWTVLADPEGNEFCAFTD